jgi:hypothetical protein
MLGQRWQQRLRGFWKVLRGQTARPGKATWRIRTRLHLEELEIPVVRSAPGVLAITRRPKTRRESHFGDIIHNCYCTSLLPCGINRETPRCRTGHGCPSDPPPRGHSRLHAAPGGGQHLPAPTSPGTAGTALLTDRQLAGGRDLEGALSTSRQLSFVER